MDNNTDDASLIESMIKLLIVGASQAGKSALLTRFCNKTFTNTYTATKGVSFKYKMLEFISKKVKVQLWDVGGNDHADPLLKIYYKKAMGIVLVFSLDDHQSFEKLNVWLEYLKVHAHSNALVILVGTKSDLNKKVISTEEIQDFQQKYRIKMYFETSAKDDKNVNETFVELITEVKNKNDNGSFKIEENRVLTSSPLLKKASALENIDLKNKEESSRNNIKIVEQIKVIPVIEKKENGPSEKKIEDLLDATKQEISAEVEEIRKSVREEMELYFREELNKVKRELNDKILQKADKSDVTQIQREKLERLKERYSDQEKVDSLKNDLSSLSKAFEGFSQSLTEEMMHTKAKAEKTLDSIIKENSSIEKRISEIEKKLHSGVIEQKQTIYDNLEFPDRTLTQSSMNPAKLLESGRIWDEDDFKHENHFYENSPTHLIIRESNLESQNGYPKRRHISIDANTTLTEATYLQEATMKRHEPGQGSVQEGVNMGFAPQSMIAFGGDDEIVKNILELKNSMANLEEELKDVQKRMPLVGSQKRQSRILKSKRGSRMDILGGLSRVDVGKYDSEISRIWETLNTLIENTHTEIDRVKEEFKFVKKRQLSEGKFRKVQESIVEDNLYGALGELRNDVHNQLIEVQKDLEESYGTFKTNVICHHESFFKRFYGEQNRFKKCIEEICMETIKEQLSKENSKVMEKSSSETLVTEPPSNKDIGMNENGAFDAAIEKKRLQTFQVKITSIETQLRQMISSYSGSFQSLWENINILVDKMNKLEEKDVFYSELGELGNFVNEGYNIDWKNKDI